jgi:putative endonuclease
MEGLIMPAWVYVLRLTSGNLYVGSTTDIEKRYEEHCTKRACRTTTLDPPIALVYSEEYETFSEARRREAQVKRWSRAKKEALVAGDLITLRNLSKSRKNY